jgi:hypothetical protein
MRFAVRCAFVLGLVGLSIAGCAADRPEGTADGGELGSGGKGAGGKGTGGGSPAMMCAADTKGDGCRKCLAGACCSDYTACVNTPSCTKALDEQESCVTKPGAEMSECFGALTRSLYGDAGGAFPPLLECFIMECSAVCGGPGAV